MLKKIFSNGFPFYPLLIGVNSVLFLWSVNAGQAIPAMTIRSFLVTSFICLAVYLTCILLIRRLNQAALVSGWILTVLFGYGHFYAMVDNLRIGSFLIGRHRFFIPLVFILSFVVIQSIMRSRTNSASISRILNFITLVMMIMNLVPILFYEIRYGSQMYASHQIKTNVVPQDDAPDVYYIILDRYTRQDELSDFFQYDNSPFIMALEDLGFYIPDCAFSNYFLTTPSLSSSMNMEYLDTLGISQAAMTDSFHASLSTLLIQSKIRQEFEQMGYKMAAFRGYLPAQDWRKADYYFNYAEHQKGVDLIDLHRFERLLMRTTILQPLMEAFEVDPDRFAFFPSWLLDAMELRPDLYFITEQEWYRQSLYNFDTLPTIPGLPGKKFVYAHLYSTHTPFVFTEDGEYQAPEKQYKDDGYVPSVKYTNKRILEIVQKLIEGSSVKPIIIIQSDHGYNPGIHRNMILNAYYFPDGNYSRLYSTITPVNTFRVILSQFFGRDFTLLPDIVWYQEAGSEKESKLFSIPAACNIR